MTFLRIGDVDLYSEATGHGDPVLLLHGGFCSLESLRPQGDALAARHRVLAFERPGHGRSADVDDEYSYARGVADAVAYLDALDERAVHVVGYSDGAIIGLLLALEHPERVASLVLISANLDPSAFTGAEGPTLGAALDTGSPPRVDTERAHYERLSPDGPEHADVVLGKLLRLWTQSPPIDPADLACLSAPTLVMSADRDSIRLEHAVLIASSIPGAQLCIVPGTTHGLVGERPELISTIVRHFLAPGAAAG